MANEYIDKKPSYLNLACCVNGYSNLTTYDSMIRKGINESREISPIRPTSNSIQNLKNSSPLITHAKHDSSETTVSIKKKSLNNTEKVVDVSNNSNLIQQRVERLYGPGALAPSFYGKKRSMKNKDDLNVSVASELSTSFRQVSISRQLEAKNVQPITTDNINADLPVFRHLSQEFRSQLPITPLKLVTHKSAAYNGENSSVNDLKIEDTNKTYLDEPDNIAHYISNHTKNQEKTLSSKLPTDQLHSSKTLEITEPIDVPIQKDGTYFLNILKAEQNRLLLLADEADHEMELLSNNPDISEDTFGFLRSAAGKSRLLVSQKLQQFAGLCKKNIECADDDEFPTTLDDLQGFWDMVHLQIDNIDAIFAEIAVLKKNGWKKSITSDVSKTQNKCDKTLTTKIKSKIGSTIIHPTSSSNAMKRESQRKALQELKKKKRNALVMNLNCSENGSNGNNL